MLHYRNPRFSSLQAIKKTNIAKNRQNLCKQKILEEVFRKSKKILNVKLSIQIILSKFKKIKKPKNPSI